MRRSLRAFPIALFAVTLSASAALAQIEIGGLNHYLCHKAKDSKFHPDKFPKDAGRDPASVIAVEMRDRLAGDLFGGTAQLYDFNQYKGVCTPTTKEKIVAGGTAGDGNEFPVADAAVNLVDLQVKQSKKDPSGNANPPGTAQKVPKGTRFRVVTQFYDEVVELKGPALALIGADEVGHGTTIGCSIEAECDAIDPGLTCNPATKTCLPADPLGGLPGTPRSGPNFTCYQAKQLAAQPPVLVLAQNQLTEAVTQPDEPLLFSISKMTRLCLPSDKEGENPGAEDSFDHLACYKAKQATSYNDPAKTKFSSALDAFLPGKPPKFGGGAVSVQTANFGERVLDVKGASEFCTPAFTSTVGDDDGIPSCGDGDVYTTPGALFEQCDDGNAVNGDGCSATCQLEEFCGDGIEQPGIGEQCDDGNAVSGDGCSATCQDEFCGDGAEQPGLGEECDDGNAVNGDGCNASCEDEFCGDGIEQSGIGEECDDGNLVDEDGCSSACLDEFCGDGVTQAGLDEECDGMDDLACPGDCDSECLCTSGPIPPTAFRLNSVALADPPVFFAGSINILGTVNTLIDDAVTMDADPMDGFFDLSLITLFRPLLQSGLGGSLDLGGAECTFPGPSTCNPSDPLDPLAGFTSADFTNVGSGVCLAHDPAVVGPNNNGTPGVTMHAPVAGADGCAVVDSADITLNLLGLELPLQAVEVGVEYSGNPATGLLDGLLIGFLDETTASTVILPADLPLVGGQPLTSLLRTNERDTGPGGVLGWWFHVNFTGTLATWTGP